MEVAATQSYAGGKAKYPQATPVGGKTGVSLWWFTSSLEFLFGHSSEIINLPAEILQLPRDDNKKGVWTLITQPMSRRLRATFPVKFNRRITNAGELLIYTEISLPKSPGLHWPVFILGLDKACEELTSTSTSELLVRIPP